jgi:hypothetical protein
MGGRKRVNEKFILLQQITVDKTNRMIKVLVSLHGGKNSQQTDHDQPAVVNVSDVLSRYEIWFTLAL